MWHVGGIERGERAYDVCCKNKKGGSEDFDHKPNDFSSYLKKGFEKAQSG